MTPQNPHAAIALPLLFDSDAPLFLTEDPETLADAARKALSLDFGGGGGGGGGGGEAEGISKESCHW